MRARQPDRQDVVDRNGVKVGFEVYDGGARAAARGGVTDYAWAVVEDDRSIPRRAALT